MPDIFLTGLDAGSAQACQLADDLCELDTLLTRCMDDAALASNLLKRFDARLAAVVNEICHLVAETKWSDAIRRVHSLKGEAGSLATTRLQKSVAELEQCLRIGRWSEISPTVAEMESSCEQFRLALPSLLERLAKSANDKA